MAKVAHYHDDHADFDDCDDHGDDFDHENEHDNHVMIISDQYYDYISR